MTRRHVFYFRPVGSGRVCFAGSESVRAVWQGRTAAKSTATAYRPTMRSASNPNTGAFCCAYLYCTAEFPRAPFRCFESKSSKAHLYVLSSLNLLSFGATYGVYVVKDVYEQGRMSQASIYTMEQISLGTNLQG
jgi:hypothetical protein